MTLPSVPNPSLPDLKTVRVDLGPRSYDVLIGRGLLDHSNAWASQAGIKGPVAIISDTIQRQHLEELVMGRADLRGGELATCPVRSRLDLKFRTGHRKQRSRFIAGLVTQPPPQRGESQIRSQPQPHYDAPRPQPEPRREAPPPVEPRRAPEAPPPPRPSAPPPQAPHPAAPPQAPHPAAPPQSPHPNAPRPERAPERDR